MKNLFVIAAFALTTSAFGAEDAEITKAHNLGQIMGFYRGCVNQQVQNDFGKREAADVYKVIRGICIIESEEFAKIIPMGSSILHSSAGADAFNKMVFDQQQYVLERYRHIQFRRASGK